MPAKLTDEQIKQELTEGRNYKRLYHELKGMFDEVVKDHRQCPKLLAEQKTYFEGIVETQNARITELETMVFGRKPRGGKLATATPQPGSKAVRLAHSYRRPLPPASAITTEKHHAIATCHRCGHELTNKDEAIRYVEDIVLAALNPEIPHKTVTKHAIETGWCSRCGQWSSARDLRGQVVTIGPVVRSLIVYLVAQADQTYAQTQDLLWQLYHFSITSSEIVNILAARREIYLPTYEALKQSVRAGPVHMDETRYRIQSEQGAGYAWTMASATSTDVVLHLADSRGRGNAESLVGDNYLGIGITDRYGAYKHLFQEGHHQICWAHLQRNARDITHLECLNKQKLKHVTKFYQGLATIYAELRQYQAELFDQEKRKRQAAELLERITQLCVPHSLDPKKLTDLKAGILEYQDSLFVCLVTDGIPADNNKAERSLRKLVIKRKKSLSVKTLKGARTLEVLMSICQTLYNRDRDNFLPALHALATARA